MRSSASRLKFILISTAILAFAFWVRVMDLEAWPVFIDEGTHLYWTRLFAAGRSDYPYYMDGRLLAIVLFAGLDPAGASLWLGRALAALLATFNAAAGVALGRRLGGTPWAGWLTGVLYAVLPLAVFHDRQMLTQTVSAAFGSLIFISGLWLAAPASRRPAAYWKASAIFATGLSTAILSNVNAVLLVFFPALAWLTVPRQRSERVTLALRFLATGFAAAILAGAFLWSMRSRLGEPGGVLTDTDASLVQCPPALCRGDWAEQWRRLPGALNSLAEIVPPYLGWGLVALAVVGAIAPGPRRREAAAFGLTILAFLTATVASVTSIIFPRYVIYLIVPFVALAVRGFALIIAAAPGRWRLAAATVGLAALFWATPNTLTLVTRPTEAALPPVDVRQYRTGIYTGIGFEEAVAAMEALRPSPTQPATIVLGTKWHVLPLAAYADPARFETQAAEDLSWPEAGRLLESGRTVFVLEEVAQNQPPAAGAIIIPRSGEARPLRVRAFDAPTPEGLSALYGVLFIRPDAYLDQYDALLADNAAERAALLPWPPHQAALLRERPNAAGVELVEVGGPHPWETAAAIQFMSAQNDDRPLMRAVFFNETRLDPERKMETWLNTHRFRLGEQWYGPLRMVEYARDGPVAQSLTISARFGEVMILERAELLNVEAAPGGVLRLRLIWRAEAAVTQRLKVFVHVVSVEGTLIAQHDGQPVGELRPTDTWQAGETITDQFALRLPADAPPGAYQLRIGLYDGETLARTSVQLADGTLSEFYVGGEVTLK